ncbi:Amino-acid carrier protein AlsT [anaerobic digester metagenome]
MDAFMKLNSEVNGIVWGPPMLILLIGAGLILVFVTGLVVYRRFGFVMKNTFGKMFDKTAAAEGGITPFQAVSTALAATVGTGNIAGVATAIASGGPGAVFWMWFAAIIGMTTKFAEVTLSIAYRERNEAGEYSGGPMYYITNGLGMKWLATIFAIFGALAAFGIGSMTQANSIAAAMENSFGIPKLAMGIIIAVAAGIILIGGIKRIGQFAEKIVPFMAAAYILGALVILVIEAKQIPAAFGLIFGRAFSLEAAGGGLLGYTVMQAMRFGVARGVFTNEAGLGSAPIAHAAATTDHPVRQGLWGAFEVFVDTIMICSMTALVILTSGMADKIDPNTGKAFTGAALTTQAFNSGFNGGGLIVTFGILLFAFTTIVGWCYYGEKCMEYLVGSKAIIPYRIVFVLSTIVGAIGALTIVWDISDTLNGLMAIPNLIALIALSGVVAKLVKDFFKDPNRIRTSPAEYESALKRPKK